MDYLGTLNQLASRFGLSSSGSKLEWSVKLEPSADALDPTGLGLTETVQTLAQTALPIAIDLGFVGKWVRSATSNFPGNPNQEDPIGGMPVADQHVVSTATDGLTSNLPPATLMTSDQGMATIPGVPEILGRIQGTVTQTVERVTDVVTRHPISIAVRWRLFDDSTPGVSVPASNVQYRVPPATNWEPLGTQPDGLKLPSNGEPAANTSLTLNLRFPAMYSELKSATPELMAFRVQASVKLGLTPAPNAAEIKTGWIDLPSVPLLLPTIPIPTILVLCEHREFAGRKLVLVPTDSLLGTAIGSGGISVGAALELTTTALESLIPDHALTSFLGASGGTLGTAAHALKAVAPSQGQTIVDAHSRVDNLSADAFVFSPGTFGLGRFTGDDMASSLICLGRPGTVFDFFFDPNLVENVTRLQFTLDNRLGCVVKKLDKNDPAAAGDIIYGGLLTSSSPREGHFYEDRISSLSFAGPPTRFLPSS